MHQRGHYGGIRQPRQQRLPDITTMPTKQTTYITKSRNMSSPNNNSHYSLSSHSPIRFQSDPVLFSPPPPPLAPVLSPSENLKALADLHGGGQHLLKPHMRKPRHNLSPASFTSPNNLHPQKLASSCITCAEDISGRCTYCLREKSSMVPRMKLHELGKRILDEHPTLSTDKFLNMLTYYGRSSNAALDLNTS